MPCAPVRASWLDLPLDELPFVAVDTETTGYAPPSARLTEIAVLPLQPARAKLVSLVNPQHPIPGKIQEITGITDRMVRTAPTVEQLLPALQETFAETIFVAHHVNFDWWFFDHVWRQHLGKPFSLPWVCTLNLSRQHLGLAKNNLALVARHVGVPLTQAHRAEADALAVVGILRHFLARWTVAGHKTGRDLVANGILQLQPPRAREERPVAVPPTTPTLPV